MEYTQKSLRAYLRCLLVILAWKSFVSPVAFWRDGSRWGPCGQVFLVQASERLAFFD